MTYTYICSKCGAICETVNVPTARFECIECGADMVLDEDWDEEGGGLSDA